MIMYVVGIIILNSYLLAQLRKIHLYFTFFYSVLDVFLFYPFRSKFLTYISFLLYK